MRVDYGKAFPKGVQAMVALDTAIGESSLEPALLELVKMRSSQINGCGFCLDMHSQDAVAMGETPQRLFVLDAWREAPFYSDRERTALAWCEALTLVADTAAPDKVFEQVRAQFSDAEIAALTFQIIAINGWNRLAIGLRAPVGTYTPAQATAA